MRARVLIPRVDAPKEADKPSWHPITGSEGQTIAVVRCGLCGRSYEVDYDIDTEGNVDPTLFCPHPICGWHVSAKLEGWPP